jgi:hypothetical protein
MDKKQEEQPGLNDIKKITHGMQLFSIGIEGLAAQKTERVAKEVG